MTEFLDLEAQDAVRMPWNVLPGTKSESAQCVIPISAIYTPLKPLPAEVPTLPYAPLRCRNCRSVLNPFAIVDFSTLNNKIWICCFCLHRNHFPPHYQAISDANLPAELFPQYTTIEYEDPNFAASDKDSTPPVFLFVVDISVIEEELAFLKSALLQVCFCVINPPPPRKKCWFCFSLICGELGVGGTLLIMNVQFLLALTSRCWQILFNMLRMRKFLFC